jgi:hypothetical protein
MRVFSLLFIFVHAEVHEVAEHHHPEGYRQHPTTIIMVCFIVLSCSLSLLL